MKKLILCLCLTLITSAFLDKNVRAGEPAPSYLTEAGLKKYISNVFRHIDFSNSECLSFDVFDKAFRGYLNLLNEGRLSGDKHILTICDFSLSSTSDRMWIIDLDKNKVLLNTLVAHGHGSGKEFATSFSNRNATHKSSLGFYVTGDTYDGDHGTSLHLYGMDPGFNDAAFDRGIVVHGADYVSKQFILNNDNCLGRSWGCPAVPARLSSSIINTIKGGTCLFIYYPEKKYLAKSKWLNTRIEHLPDANNSVNSVKIPRPLVIEYVSSKGTIDSVKNVNQ
jgi:hypothetical protein